jgi:hypothetical protein
VPWPRRLVPDLSQRRPGLVPGSAHVGFVVDKVTLRQIISLSSSVFPVSIVPPWLSTILSGGMKKRKEEAAVQRHSLIPIDL